MQKQQTFEGYKGKGRVEISERQDHRDLHRCMLLGEREKAKAVALLVEGGWMRSAAIIFFSFRKAKSAETSASVLAGLYR
jgi:hypothetical protein